MSPHQKQEVLPVEPGLIYAQARENKKYLRGVQGLRTVAAVMVAIYHIWFHRVSGGVDVFFVVAGYFAAKSLTRVVVASSFAERARAARDYILRVGRRVVPSATIVIIATVTGSMLWLPPTTWANNIREALASALFLENFQLILLKTDYAQMDAATSPFQQFWALSIQVQSYVSFAIIVLLVISAARLAGLRPSPALVSAITAIFALSFGYSIYSTSSNQTIAYFNLASRYWEFLAGVIFAFVLPRLRLGRTTARVIGWMGLSTIIVFAAFVDMSRLLPGWIALVPVSAAAAVIASSYHGVEPKLLVAKPVMTFADSSFAFYLWHWPLLIFYRAQVSSDVSLLAGLVILLLAGVLAIITTRFVEKPFRDWRSLERKPSLSLLATLLLLSPAFLTAGYWQLALSEKETEAWEILREYRTSGDVPRGVASIPAPIIAKADTTEANRNGCAAWSMDTTLFSCSWGNSSDPSPIVALVGASHDTQWLTVVVEAADSAGAQTISYLKNACPFGNVSEATRDIARGCEKWSDQLIDELLRHPPDVVVSIATSWDDGIEAIPDWKREYFELLMEAGTIVVGIRDNPSFATAGPTCVESGDLSECTTTADESFRPLEELGLPPDPKFIFVDLEPNYCPNGICSALQSPLLGYSDTDHLTETWTLMNGAHLADAIRSALGD